MKNRKFIFVFLLILIFVVGFFAIRHAKDKKSAESECNNDVLNEYVPQEEISDEQLRDTIVSLYFPDKETSVLKPEARLVNVKELIKQPYNILISLLINGPKNDKFCRSVPDDTKLLNVNLDGECLVLDFSEEFLNFKKDDVKVKDNLIYSIVNTVTELNEVNKVRFLIVGQENEEFKGEFVRK